MFIFKNYVRRKICYSITENGKNNGLDELLEHYAYQP